MQVEILYRDFYDVPRMLVVSHRDLTFLLDCPFDEDLDEYPEHYAVYEIPQFSDQQLSGSWIGFTNFALRTLKPIAVVDVQFDPTKRRSIDSAVLDEIIES